eukprot:2943057-Rhodomonas_salina.3
MQAAREKQSARRGREGLNLGLERRSVVEVRLEDLWRTTLAALTSTSGRKGSSWEVLDLIRMKIGSRCTGRASMSERSATTGSAPVPIVPTMPWLDTSSQKEPCRHLSGS